MRFSHCSRNVCSKAEDIQPRGKGIIKHSWLGSWCCWWWLVLPSLPPQSKIFTWPAVGRRQLRETREGISPWDFCGRRFGWAHLRALQAFGYSGLPKARTHIAEEAVWLQDESHQVFMAWGAEYSSRPQTEPHFVSYTRAVPGLAAELWHELLPLYGKLHEFSKLWQEYWEFIPELTPTGAGMPPQGCATAALHGHTSPQHRGSDIGSTTQCGSQFLALFCCP